MAPGCSFDAIKVVAACSATGSAAAAGALLAVLVAVGFAEGPASAFFDAAWPLRSGLAVGLAVGLDATGFGFDAGFDCSGRLAAVLVGFLGAFIILRPGFEAVSLGQLAQLCAAPLFAASFLLAKRLTDQEDPAAIVGMLSLFCTLTLLPGAILQWRTPSPEELFWLTLTAVFATAGHYTLTRAFSAAPITVTQPISFLQLVWAALLGMVAFGEDLDPYIFAGGGIIVAAATYISHREVLAARRLQTPPAIATKI